MRPDKNLERCSESEGSEQRSSTPPVYRFAPSPNGYLHLGHARSALVGFEAARRTGGRFLVRIEDIDTTRTRQDFVGAIFEDLAWLGITWETPVLHQSHHFARYRAAAERLEAAGLLYPCFATRTEIAEAAKVNPSAVDPDGAPLYPGLHRALPAAEVAARRANGEPFALRLHMDRALEVAARHLSGAPLVFAEGAPGEEPLNVAAEAARWGDAVIVRKDVPASYHLAVVVDDAHQGITHVTRGMDLYAATGLHRLLQVLLGLPAPSYFHHRLIMTADGRKLAKSRGDTAIRALRAAGISAAEVRRRALDD